MIGTRIATQVLKDGDLVEVDAEKGGSEDYKLDNMKLIAINVNDYKPLFRFTANIFLWHSSVCFFVGFS